MERTCTISVKQHHDEINRLSRHRWGYRDDTCEIPFFPSFYSFSLFLSLSHARARAHTHTLSFSLSLQLPYSVHGPRFISRFTDPSTKEQGFLWGDTILERSNCPHGFLVFFSRSFFFFSLIRYVPPVSDRFKGLQPGLRWRPCGSYPRIIRKVCPVVTETRHAGRQSESPRLSRSFDGLISPLDFGRQNGSLNQNGW